LAKQKNLWSESRGKKKLDKKSRNQLRKTVEEQKSKVNIPIDTDNYLCPRCGQKMTVTDSYYKTEKKDLRNLFCEKCNILGKARIQHGKAYLYSTPVDEETRAYRAEAHYYFDKLVENRIFNSTEEAYRWLQYQIFTIDAENQHIGEFNKAFCMLTMEASLKVLVQNKHRLKNRLKPYESRKEKSYTETSKNMQELFQQYTDEE